MLEEPSRLSIRLRAAGFVLLVTHLVGMYFGGFSILGVTTWTALFTIAGTLAVPLVAWDLAGRVDHLVEYVAPDNRVRSGLLRGLMALALLAATPTVYATFRSSPLPAIARFVELSTALLSTAIAVALVLLGLAVADVLYQITARFHSLSTRLMVLLLFASVWTFLWLGALGASAKQALEWAIEQGHLGTYEHALEHARALAAERAGSFLGGLAGLIGLELPFTLLLAWRFGQNATRGLSVLREGFTRVAAGELERPVEVSGNDEVADMQRGFNEMLTAARERRLLETAFGRYVSPVVLERVRAKGGGMLAPERRVATVLFSDLRGFTALSATLTPEDVIRFLNAYMSRMIEVIARYDGYINKFVGDAILVVFGAPLAQPDHALRALACASAMQEELFRANERGELGELHLEMGIGINSGELVLGNLGNARQVEFTVLGDTVNVASRVCGKAAAWQVATTARVLEEARARAGRHDVVAAESLGVVELKGKGATELWRLASVRADLDAALLGDAVGG